VGSPRHAERTQRATFGYGSGFVAAASASVYWRRRALALLGLVVLVVLLVLVVRAIAGGGASSGTAAGAEQAAARPDQAPAPELPRGGRQIFPDFRVVAFYGAPQDDELGILGIGTPTRAGIRLERQAKPYARKSRPILPAMELIATVAAAAPGDDGKYRMRQSDAVIRRYLKAARKIKALLILDIQPGRADFFTETTRLRKWLEQPDVGLALDPEWRMGPGEVPGRTIGSVSSREVNATTAWLSQLVKEKNLPEKLVLLHEFTDDMVQESTLRRHPGLAYVLNIDGFGGREIKTAKYHRFVRSAPKGFRRGFKLFYKEDTGLMTPPQVMRLSPRPDVVVYE
jgi:hypothetical protein